MRGRNLPIIQREQVGAGGRQKTNIAVQRTGIYALWLMVLQGHQPDHPCFRALARNSIPGAMRLAEIEE